MQYTRISKKQANVLYKNMKDGNITIKDDLVKFMYDRAEAHYSYNTLDDATEDYLLGAVDAVFKNDFSRAQECIDSAWTSYGSTHGLLETETVTDDEFIDTPAEVETTCTNGGSEHEGLQVGDEVEFYTFAYYNGNCGAEIPFATREEAEEAAEIDWEHHTPRERKAYADRTKGAYFGVFRGPIDDGDMVRDFVEEMEEARRQAEEDDERTHDSWTCDKRIGTQGHSLVITITEGCRLMGLDKGDVVEVTIRRK